MIDTSTIVTGLIAEGVEPEVAEESVKQYVAKNTIKMKRLARKLRKQIKREQPQQVIESWPFAYGTITQEMNENGPITVK